MGNDIIDMRIALGRGDIKRMERLKNQGVDLNDTTLGLPHLYKALAEHQISAAQWLKDNGADVHIRIRSVTLLFFVASDGNYQGMHWLIQNGLDINETFFDSKHTIMETAMGVSKGSNFVHGGSIGAVALCCHYEFQIDLSNSSIYKNIIKYIDPIFEMEFGYLIPPYNIQGIFNILKAFSSLDTLEAKKFSYSVLQKIQSNIDKSIGLHMQEQCEMYYGLDLKLVLSRLKNLEKLHKFINWPKSENQDNKYLLKFDNIVDKALKKASDSKIKLEKHNLLLLEKNLSKVPNSLSKIIEKLDLIQQFLDEKDILALFFTSNPYNIMNDLLDSEAKPSKKICMLQKQEVGIEDVNLPVEDLDLSGQELGY